MANLQGLLENNRQWVENSCDREPDFFRKLARSQDPEYLWIGCSDSRVMPDKLVGLSPGSVFVHRNVGNVFASNDLNCLAVLQYAIEVLKVPNILICGHYDCGGIRASLRRAGTKPIDLWVDQIRNVYERFEDELKSITDENERRNRLTELNVQAQVHNICRSAIVQDAWQHGQTLTVHGVVYSIHDGLLKDVGVSISSLAEFQHKK
ncbi:MAG: carbonic anhydrase [Mariprofundaceae bacterium]